MFPVHPIWHIITLDMARILNHPKTLWANPDSGTAQPLCEGSRAARLQVQGEAGGAQEGGVLLDLGLPANRRVLLSE